MAKSPDISTTSQRLRARRALGTAAAAALSLSLGACSSEGSTDWSALYSTLRDSWVSSGEGVSLNEAGAIPYATLGVRLDGGEEHIFVLATDSQGERLWVSSAHISLAVRDGRIVRTSGLTADLSGFAPGSNLRGPWTMPRTVTWTVDFIDQGIYSAAVVCKDVPAGRETTTILGAELDTVRIDETCRSDSVGWSFSNTYWVSPTTGRVWRSRQFVHPKGGPVEFEILRPPDSAG